MRIKLPLFALAGVCSVITAVNAAEPNLPTTQIMGKEYYYYEAGKDESLYGIAKKFDWDIDEIIKSNPQAVAELSNGTLIYYPTGRDAVADSAPKSVSSSSSGKIDLAPITYTANKNETIYSISKQYNVPLEELYALNPETKSGIKAGQKILIPQSVNSKYLYYTVKKGDMLSVIARNYGITVNELIKENPGVSEKKLQIGKTLRIINKSYKPENTEGVAQENKTSTGYEISTMPLPISEETRVNVPGFTPSAADSIQNQVTTLPLPVSEETRVNVPGFTASVTETTQNQVSTMPLPVSEETRVNVPGFTQSAAETTQNQVSTMPLPISEETRVNVPGFTPSAADSIQNKIATLPMPEASRPKIPVPGITPTDKYPISTMPLSPSIEAKVNFPHLTFGDNDSNNSFTTLPLEPSDETRIVINDSVLNVPTLSMTSTPMLNTVKVALLLDDPKSKKDVDFLRGFLVALNDMKGAPFKIDLKVMDGSSSTEEITNQFDVFNPNLVIATADKTFPLFLADYGNTNGVEIVNVFNVKNDLYKDNGSVVQLLPPTGFFNDNIADKIKEDYPDRKLLLIGNPDDNDGIASSLASLYDTPFVMPMTLAEFDIFQPSESESYIIYSFVSKKDEVNQFFKTLDKLTSENSMDLTVLGRSHWITMLESMNVPFSKYGIMIPSRVALEDNAAKWVNFRSKFQDMFKASPIKSFPNFAVTGYDVANYFLPTIAYNGGNFDIPNILLLRDPIQTDINIIRANSTGGGFLNSSSYLLKYTPDKTIEMILVR